MTHRDLFDPIADCLVAEEEFDRAFSCLEAVPRAWIKKNIAQLHTIYSSSSQGWYLQERTWPQGFWTREEVSPVAQVAVSFPYTFNSPAQLVAAVVPPLSLGVQRCCALRVGAGGEPWPHEVLGALELSGVEEVYDTSAEKFREWMESVGADPQLGLVFLEDFSWLGNLECGNFVRLPGVETLGVWFQHDLQWDLVAIRSAHPRARIICGPSEVVEESADCESLHESWSDIMSQAPNGLYIPESMFDLATPHCSRILGPGQEGCWIWPELKIDTFQRRISLLAGDQQSSASF